MHIQSLTGSWQFRNAGTDEVRSLPVGWLPGQVPGGVHTDLLALGHIPDPFVADNEKHVQWVAKTDWEYRRSFSADAALLSEDKVFLVCDGLDTLAEVRLNGHLLGKTDNMFRQYEWEVKSLLRPGENEIAIAFGAPATYRARRTMQHGRSTVSAKRSPVGRTAEGSVPVRLGLGSATPAHRHLEGDPTGGPQHRPPGRRSRAADS